MSYRLDPVTAPPAEKSVELVDRCSGLTWASSFGAGCAAEARVPAAARAPSPAAPAAAAEAARESAPPSRKGDGPETVAIVPEGYSGYALPTLGSPGNDARVLREASAREVQADGTRSADPLFRFASKYRVRRDEEGWEATRFKDAISENRTQATGVKAVGVELLFPFQ